MKLFNEKAALIQDDYRVMFYKWISLEEIYFVISEYAIQNETVAIGHKLTNQAVLGVFLNG